MVSMKPRELSTVLARSDSAGIPEPAEAPRDQIAQATEPAVDGDPSLSRFALGDDRHHVAHCHRLADIIGVLAAVCEQSAWQGRFSAMTRSKPRSSYVCPAVILCLMGRPAVLTRRWIRP